ncbi:hypothetical protein M409DRAFT_57457 [Zasmidium cellare ATCC 36951]|uniref:Uncharacterized protein n=1 Tax=Zasmidium cellare ATCC 36951 TaxID=1080233 RepID=A0A6A6C8V0_ZASCE|nr:uncharacterized protein M409DRAFT_57457 [Zasmidium cellare ATCC 36951]KAF2163574.1 hypothetical protein M409DRAFT_57457 [Zasmidium cellare ATCC 36951]
MRARFKPPAMPREDLLGADRGSPTMYVIKQTSEECRLEPEKESCEAEDETGVPCALWEGGHEARNKRDDSNSRWALIARNEFHRPTGPAFVSPSGSVSITIASPVAYRLQFRTRSCDIWFPQKLVSGMEAAFGFMMMSMHTCPALVVALDASSLCHLGQEFGDPRLFKAGLGMHTTALSLLRKELENSADRLNRAHVGTIVTLQITEAFRTMDFAGEGWLHHSKGLTALLDNLDDDMKADPNAPGWPELVGCSFYLFHFWSGIAARRRIRSFGQSGGTALISIAEQVPEALKKADAACEKGAQLSLEEGLRVINMLSTIEHELESWTKFWNPCMRSGPFHIVNSTKLFHFQPAKGKRSKNPFPLSMEFRTFFDALDHAVCTASLLVVREAMIDTCQTLLKGPHEISSSFGKRIGALKAAAHSCADSLCMAIPYFLLPSNGQYGHVIASHPLVWHRGGMCVCRRNTSKLCRKSCTGVLKLANEFDNEDCVPCDEESTR